MHLISVIISIHLDLDVTVHLYSGRLKGEMLTATWCEKRPETCLHNIATVSVILTTPENKQTPTSTCNVNASSV